jgi:ribosomal subunit interface protein
MNITMSALHCTLPAPVRRHAEARLERLARFEPRIQGIDVTFEKDHGLHRVEARISVAGGPIMVAHGTGDGFRAAIDRIVDRLGRQLKRRRERRLAHRSAGSPQGAAVVGGL